MRPEGFRPGYTKTAFGSLWHPASLGNDELSHQVSMSDDNDFLHGAAKIGAFLGTSPRRTYHLLEGKMIPAAKLGNIWTARKSRLVAHLESAENAHLGPTGEAA